ncbi:MAG: CRISPR-associated protein [Elusimicrobia bacterium CG1_02_37_114]|nr:MAG: CRISPR-associated protein [Elusimicrobia bacterium CG1_02_37_114]PIV52770.1 MAG: TIGR02221 family CRISPR-associated protein [Elusimicrobia bacterium CG02_land_8_20_14_3_00_37_13]PIZ12690.1 MAG: TIGR02221 family CRISPR-associated protein [Elusimicrobia bacterium CG_4_10_14_0_8_um_filter_37_32]
MSNKFLAFLGTNDYIECNYYLDSSQIIKNCRFVQLALAQLICRNWSENDYVIVFTTNEAKTTNWKTPNKFNKPGLEKILNDIKPGCEIKQVDIPEGKNLDEIWKIFEIILDEIDDEDNITFDVTHSFRSLPMLLMVILNYAKFLKNIQLDGIYYGAIESLGTLKDIKEMPLEKRNAPIFDLTPFVSLFNWTIGVERFLNTGDAVIISQLANEKIKPIMINSKGEDKNAKIVKGLVNSLSNFSKAVATCRSGEITKLVKNIKQKINEMQTSESLIVQMKPILDKIKEKFNNFSDNEDKNQLQAIQWCSRHKLIQQGFTLLQEFIVSYICRKNSYNVSKLKDREFISTCLSVKGRDIPEQQWNEHLKKQKEKAEKIIEQLNKEVAEIYINIGQYRNDLNHAGCVQPHDFEKFVIELENFVSKVSSLINRER